METMSVIISVVGVGVVLMLGLGGLMLKLWSDVRADIQALRTEIADDRRAHEAKHDREVAAGLRAVTS